jgi:serine protease inhibitor
LDKIIWGGPVTVGKVIHKAIVEVTKEGTEQKVLLPLVLKLSFSLHLFFCEEKNILVDRPSIFIVQHRLNNIQGRVKNPSYP